MLTSGSDTGGTPEIMRRLPGPRRQAAIRLLIVIALAALVVVPQLMARGRAEPALPSAEDIPSAAELYSVALAEAQMWRPDAYLTSIHVQIRRRPFVSFGFDSLVDPSTGLSLIAEEGASGVRFAAEEFPVEGSTETTLALRRDQWPLDSREIFAIVVKNGATEFLLDHPDSSNWFLQFPGYGAPNPDDVLWRVAFGEPFADSLDVYVDPVTGEVKEAEFKAAYAPTLVPVGRGEARVPSARDLYGPALEAARSWRSDAYLTRPGGEFRLAADPEPWTFEFNAYSSLDTAYWIEIDLSEDGDPVVTEHECPESRCRPEPAYDPQAHLDSTEAVAIALDAGGREFLMERSQADYELTVAQGGAYDAPLVWYVTLRDATVPLQEASLLQYVLDPYSGRIIRTERVR
jgi:hypothetical protein